MRAVIGVVLLVAIAPVSSRQETSAQAQAAIELSTYVAGASASHLLSFQINAGDLETFIARVEYAPEFEFRGFRTQGPPGSLVGSYELDVSGDHAPESVAPVRSLSSGSAYIDIIPDGAFSPSLEPLLSAGGATSFQLRLPFGGDANADTRVAPLGARLALRLNANIIVNPGLGGSYPVVAHLTTVDPDSGGRDDGAGAAPVTSRVMLTVPIDGPVLTPFAKLRVEDFGVRLHVEPSRDRFVAAGRFVLGQTSDGIDAQNDSVTVSFASFSQTIPASAFRRNALFREYRGGGTGIHRLKVWSDGRFEMDVQRLHLIIPEKRQAFGFGVGNDVGQTFVAAPLSDPKSR